MDRPAPPEQVSRGVLWGILREYQGRDQDWTGADIGSNTATNSTGPVPLAQLQHIPLDPFRFMPAKESVQI